jgi:hypothetical protein
VPNMVTLQEYTNDTARKGARRLALQHRALDRASSVAGNLPSRLATSTRWGAVMRSHPTRQDSQ